MKTRKKTTNSTCDTQIASYTEHHQVLSNCNSSPLEQDCHDSLYFQLRSSQTSILPVLCSGHVHSDYYLVTLATVAVFQSVHPLQTVPECRYSKTP